MGHDSLPENDLQAQHYWHKELGDASAISNWTISQFEDNLGTKILEVGCGIGTFTKLLAQNGAEILGLDMDHKAVEIAMAETKDLDGVTIELADVTKRKWNAEFDTVVAIDVIEHIENDYNIMNSLYQTLSPGGNIIIKVPAMPSVYCTLDESVGHYRRYSRQSIIDVMTGAGFQNVQVKFFNVLGIAGWWFNGVLLKRRIPMKGQVELFARLLPIVRVLDWIAPRGIGLSLIAVGSKPVHESD